MKPYISTESNFLKTHRLVYSRAETPSESVSAETIADDALREGIQNLEDSADGPLLCDALTEYIAKRYPDVAERLRGRHIGVLLEAAAEVGDYEESDETPRDIIRSVIRKAVEHRLPNGQNQEILNRVDVTMGAGARVRRHRGDEIISAASQPLDTPALRELRNKLRNLDTQYDKYFVASNKAAVEFIKREINLRKLLERQGYQYDATKEADDYYYFTEDYKLIKGNETRERTPDEIEAVEQALAPWNSWGWQYERSNNQLESYDSQIKKVEAQIRAEEAKQ